MPRRPPDAIQDLGRHKHSTGYKQSKGIYFVHPLPSCSNLWHAAQDNCDKEAHPNWRAMSIPVGGDDRRRVLSLRSVPMGLFGNWHGPTMHDAIENSGNVFEKQLGDNLDGSMDLEGLREATSRLIAWPSTYEDRAYEGGPPGSKF